MNTTTKEAIKNAFLAIEAGAEMTSSVKIAEYRYITTNSDNIWSLNESINNQVSQIRFDVTSKYKASFLVKYNLVADNDSFLVTFWVEIFPKNGVKSEKVSENPGKTPQDIVKDMISGPNSRAFGKSWIRDYFSAPANTRNIHVNSFPSCAGLVDSIIKIDNRPKKNRL